jgi:hypothetical protein
MYKIFIALILFSIVLQAQPIIKFENTIYNHGIINYYSNGVSYFKFKNIGNKPLIITNAQTNCGCFKVDKWPKEPIMPNKSGVIVCRYDTERIGRFEKTATITTNAENLPNVVLQVKGDVKRYYLEVNKEYSSPSMIRYDILRDTFLIKNHTDSIVMIERIASPEFNKTLISGDRIINDSIMVDSTFIFKIEVISLFTPFESANYDLYYYTKKNNKRTKSRVLKLFIKPEKKEK